MPETGASDDGQAAVVEWIEREIGPVRRITRQGRWRPAWFVTAEKAGEAVELYARGARGAHWPPMPLAYEAQVQAVFFEAGVKVPRVHGSVEGAPAFVMDAAPGRADMATADGDAARERLREQLADQMIKIHAIDPARVAALGAPTAEDPREQTLLYYRAAEKLYLEGDRLPSPDIEFVRRWIDRNAPPCVEGPGVITVDAGQFLFEGDEITAIVDLELACIGDRHADLAALWTRDRIEQIGDLESFYDLYERRGGMKLDRERIRFQWVPFAMLTPLNVAHDLAHPEEGGKYNEFLTWHIHTMRDALMHMADLAGVTLEPYTLPPPSPERSSLLMRALAGVIEGLPAADAFEAYRRSELALAMGALADQATRRSAFEQEYLDEIEALTGVRPRDSWDGDVRLTAFVQAAGPEHEADLLRLLNRRNERLYQTLRSGSTAEPR